MEYNFREIENKWQQQWNETGAYRVNNDSSRPKFYVLDMFPYPSGAGLHVGHPLGYIASDIYSRFKRLKGFNVLHPMGYDSFGLPAEQYAIETGQHPAVTTEENINTFRRQLDKIGFSYDWSREVRTSDPKYYKWTQWIFLQLFDSWFDNRLNKARKISELVNIFSEEGNKAVTPRQSGTSFTAEEWNAFDEKQQQDILMQFRLAYSSFGEVNWCEALGTVLANDEVVNGVSERGGFPVVKKKMRQWYLRITDYADRLLDGLETVEFSESLKEQQRNWIGKSQGAEIRFQVKSEQSFVKDMVVYTTRPDTIFGVDFMVVAPEHPMVEHITSSAQKQSIEEYLNYVKSRSERERMAEVKQITGCFTGAFALNPFDGREIPIWIAEYVLAGYGTGAIMGVPCGDQRDFNFAQHFGIPITNIIGTHFNGKEANPTKDAYLQHSGFLDGMLMKNAIDIVISRLVEMGIGKKQVNYKMRDAGFSRQRYWGEPFPVVWKEGIARPLDEHQLPLELPHVDKYGTGPEGEGPLANLKDWLQLPDGSKRETSTMPGYAGSSWYFLRYMDPHNDKEFCSRSACDYWGQVDLYIGGTEHAVGHLLYSRLWTKILHDLGFISHEEPFRKLVNQGMIQGSSRFVYRVDALEYKNGFIAAISTLVPKALFLSYGFYQQLLEAAPQQKALLMRKICDSLDLSHVADVSNIVVNPMHVDVNIVNGQELDTEAFKSWKNLEGTERLFLLEDGKYICGIEVEKMSKTKYNTVNPDILVERYGADTFRMYEMFLGPVEMSKPWDTKGIEGVHRFLRKFWRLFYDDTRGQVWKNEKPTEAELKVLHKTIKKVEEDTEKFSFNTAVSAFMVCVNELSDLKTHKKEILEQLLVLLAPYAPHVSQELWTLLGNSGYIIDAPYPVFSEKYVKESAKEYPVSVNGKVRTNINISLEATQPEVETIVLSNEVVLKWLEGKSHKKIIFVKGKMINVVI